jgi:hypothetical protein
MFAAGNAESERGRGAVQVKKLARKLHAMREPPAHCAFAPAAAAHSAVCVFFSAAAKSSAGARITQCGAQGDFLSPVCSNAKLEPPPRTYFCSAW